MIHEKIGEPEFKIGDKIRISKYKRTQAFDKGCTRNWTEEIYVVNEIKITKSITCKLVDLMGKERQGRFYEKEMQKKKKEKKQIRKYLELRKC